MKGLNMGIQLNEGILDTVRQKLGLGVEAEIIPKDLWKKAFLADKSAISREINSFTLSPDLANLKRLLEALSQYTTRDDMRRIIEMVKKGGRNSIQSILKSANSALAAYGSVSRLREEFDNKLNRVIEDKFL